MARVSKNMQPHEALVVVCEGTETEMSYFPALKSCDNVKFVPRPQEKVTSESKRNRTRNARDLKSGDCTQYTGNEYYVGLQEVDNETYRKYCQEPIRWVRATKLFMERKGFTEGWAVYDLDNKTNGRTNASHQKARELAHEWGVHIAFSAYSIEEWFLFHYERNSQPFFKSDCEHFKEGVVCGNDSVICMNCNPCEYIGGYLRKRGLIQDYQKKKGIKLAEITLENGNLHRACVNAAWSRSLRPTCQPYECNPYTDVDKLVMRLLEKSWIIEWVKENMEFKVNNTTLKLCNGEDVVTLIYVSGLSFVVNASAVYWCDTNYESIGLDFDSSESHNGRLVSPEKESVVIKKNSRSAVLCIKSGFNEFYFEATN
ncbi:MAG: RloB domain-containing protein [Bacteroidales bacterium]|jgi:hypothetical protein|nr:RloB domain-containing protein [Bacteroidales bacterium]